MLVNENVSRDRDATWHETANDSRAGTGFTALTAFDWSAFC